MDQGRVWKDRLRGGGGRGEGRVENRGCPSETGTVPNHNNDTNISNITGIQVLLNFQ